ncbi:MAG: TIGR04076 family protein [Planctomycetota bacterium]
MTRPTVKIHITESDCKYHQVGDEFLMQKLSPPLCHEALVAFYPQIFSLLHGGTVEHDKHDGLCCMKRCPDRGRLEARIELVPDPEDGVLR